MNGSEKSQSRFRRESIEALDSPSQLNDYIRVVKPGTFAALIGILLLFVAVIIWGTTGTVRTLYPISGIQQGTHLTCFVQPRMGEEIKPGMTVVFADGSSGLVRPIDYNLYTKEEVSNALGNSFYLSSMDLHDWNLRIDIDTEKQTDNASAVEGNIILKEMKPIEFLAGGGGE